jgi:hypothetical protein
MANIKKQLSIQTLKKSDFDLADACARELWRGYSYTDDSPTISDEMLMLWFSVPFVNLQRIHSTDLYIHPEHIDRFASLINMRENRIKKTLDIPNGLKRLKHICENEYADWKREPKKMSAFNIANKATKEVAESLFKTSPTTNKGIFPALSTRVLFFAAPDLPIFNYSKQVRDFLQINERTNLDNLIVFNSEMRKVFEHYWEQLQNYKMPLANGLVQDEYWILAMKGGWWQRRVLDLSLMIKAGAVNYKPFIKTIASTKLKIHN